MLFAVENSFTTFIDKMRADRVLLFEELLVEMLLLRKQNDRSEVWEASLSDVAIFKYGLFDVHPHIGRVIPVEVDDCLRQIHNSLEVDSEVRVRTFHRLLLLEFVDHISLAFIMGLSV